MMKLSKLARGVGAALLLAVPLWIAGCDDKPAVIGYYNADRIEREAGQLKALQEEGTAKLKEKQTELEGKMKEKQAALETKFQQKQSEIEAKFQAKEDEFNQKVQANPPTSQKEADRLQAEADEGIWRRVWSDEEKISFASTPLFLLRAVKMNA